MDWSKDVYRGEVDGKPVVTTLKTAMSELVKGYPLFWYYGIFESYFGHVKGSLVVKTLKEDGFLEVKVTDDKILYKLTKEGVDLAISQINLDYSRETSNYNKSTHRLTKLVIILTIISTLTGLVQAIPVIINFVQWLGSHGIRT